MRFLRVVLLGAIGLGASQCAAEGPDAAEASAGGDMAQVAGVEVAGAAGAQTFGGAETSNLAEGSNSAAASASGAGQSDAAIFEAAGFSLVGDQWQSCELTDSPSYSPGEIVEKRDINGDGRTDALVAEHSAICFGMAGQLFAIVSQDDDGSWSHITSGIGIPEFLGTSGTDGWPDIEVGGPGFCFPIIRWDGKTYSRQRWEYEGKPCTP